MSATVSVNCNNCGAPLELASSTNFVTCAHCGSRLAVKRTASAAFTEKLDEVAAHTQTMSRQLAEIAYRAELERIDREWEREKAKYSSGKSGGADRETHPVPAILMGILVAGFGIFWTATAFQIQSNRRDFFPDHASPLDGCFPFFGLIVVALVLWGMVSTVMHSGEKAKAQDAYRRRRAAVTVEQFLNPQRRRAP